MSSDDLKPLALPNPQPLEDLLTLESIDHYKKWDCVRYAKCLDIVCERGWQQFHCNDCTRYVQEAPDDPERKKLAQQLGRGLGLQDF